MYKQQQQKSSACPFLSVNQLDTEEKKKKKSHRKQVPQNSRILLFLLVRLLVLVAFM